MILHTAPISGIASDEHGRIATAGYDNRVILWDHQTGASLARGVHDHLANQCLFFANGTRLVSSGSDRTARVWHVPTMQLEAVLAGHEDDVEGLAAIGDGSRLITTSRDYKVRIFFRDGRLDRVLEGHRQDVLSAEWLAATNEIVTSSDDGTLKVWDADSGAMRREIDLGGVETDTVAVAQDGVIFAANDDGQILCLRGKGARVFEAHRAGVKRLAYSESQGKLVSISYDRTIKLWQRVGPLELKHVWTVEIPPIVWPRACCFASPDELVFTSFGTTYASLDLASGTWKLDRIDVTGGINAVLRSGPDTYTIGDAGVLRRGSETLARAGSCCNFLVACGSSVLTGGQTGELFDGTSGRVVYRHHSPLNCGTSYRIAGVRHVALGTYTGELVLLRQEADGSFAVVTHCRTHSNAVKSVCNDGTTLFSVSASGGAAWSDCRSLVTLRSQKHAHDKIANGCTSYGVGRFASVGRDLKLRLWEGGARFAYDVPQRFSVKCITAADGGRRLAMGSYGGEVAVFNVAERRFERTVNASASGISSIWGGDAPEVLASAYDGMVHPVQL